MLLASSEPEWWVGMSTATYERFVSSNVTVAWAQDAAAGDCKPWSAAPTSLKDSSDMSVVLDEYPVRCKMLVVPADFAQLTERVRPQLVIKHAVPAGGGGSASSETRTVVMIAQQVMTLLLRMMHWDDMHAGPAPSLLQLSVETMQEVWAGFASKAKGKKYETMRDAVVQIEIARRVLDDSRLKLTNARLATGLPKVVKLPAATGDDKDAIDARNAELFMKVEQIEKLRVKALVAGDGSMAKVADLLDYFGACERNADRMDPDLNMQRMTGMLMELVEGDVSAGKSSALARTRALSEDLSAKRLTVATRTMLRGAELRSYSMGADDRLEEFAVMIDLSSKVEEVRNEAFKTMLPNLVATLDALGSLYEGEKSPEVVVEQYLRLCELYTPDLKPFDVGTVSVVSNRLKAPLQRLLNEHEGKMSPAEKVTRLMSEKKRASRNEEMAPLTEKDAEKDEDSKGRAFTRAEVVEMSRMQTHSLWADFVVLVRAVKQHGGVAVDFVEAQLSSGLPVVRRQLFCRVKATGSEVMEYLLNYRMAKRKSYELLQDYLGREIMRGEATPRALGAWKASITIVEQLEAGKISAVNFEMLYAEVREAIGEPVDAVTLESFTKDNRYTNEKYLDDVRVLGSKVLKAWFWERKVLEKPEQLEGSFSQLISDHKSALRSAEGLAAGPKQDRLSSKFYGAYPCLLQALMDAEDNYVSFHEMSPAQIMVGESTTEVSRALIPFIPAGSKSHGMRKIAVETRVDMLTRAREMPYLYVAEMAARAGAQTGQLSDDSEATLAGATREHTVL